MPIVVKCNRSLYTNDKCLVFQSENIKYIEKQANFAKIFDWFVDNNASIHFGEDNAKSILIVSKRKMKKFPS